MQLFNTLICCFPMPVDNRPKERVWGKERSNPNNPTIASSMVRLQCLGLSRLGKYLTKYLVNLIWACFVEKRYINKVGKIETYHG